MKLLMENWRRFLLKEDLTIDNNFYDLTPDFCKYKNPKKLYLKYDPMHLSEKGHEFVYRLANGIINQWTV